MSLIDTECTVTDTPSDVRNYAQLEFEKFHRKKCKGVRRLVFFREKKILSQNESKCGQTGRKSCEKYVFQIEIEISTVVLEKSREIFGFSYSVNQKSDVSH